MAGLINNLIGEKMSRLKVSDCYDLEISDFVDENGDIEFLIECYRMFIRKEEAERLISHLQKVFELDNNHVNVDKIEN